MSLRDGIKITSYSELIKIESNALLFSPAGDNVYAYNTLFKCPGMVDVATGERFYSEDIQKFIEFPLYRVKLVSLTEADLNET